MASQYLATTTEKSDSAGLSGSETNNGPTNSMLGKYYCRIMVGNYKRPNAFENGTWVPHTAFHLPLPDALNDETSVKYSGTDLETVGDFINGNVGSGTLGIGVRSVGTSVSKLISAVAGSGAGAIVEGLGGTSALGDVIGGAVAEGAANAFPAGNIQTAFEQTIGMAPNPNPSVAFQGPNLREFTLSWTFFPTNKTESDNVFKIIKTLKRSSLPNNAINGSAAILGYPDMVQLNFFPWDSGGTGPWCWNTENSIIRIKKCVMGSVNVDYNPSNIPGFFADGSAPVAIRLSIGFSEIEYLLSDDWGTNANRQSENLISAIGTIAGRTAAAFNPLKNFDFEDTTT